MPAHRLNDVPIALYFATHFYFVFYHTMSNMMLRLIETRYAPGLSRTIFFWSCIIAFSYFTAFMETLTISNYEDYSFSDKDMVYKVGSFFYGLYFLVSYPVFYRLANMSHCVHICKKLQLIHILDAVYHCATASDWTKRRLIADHTPCIRQCWKLLGHP